MGVSRINEPGAGVSVTADSVPYGVSVKCTTPHLGRGCCKSYRSDLCSSCDLGNDILVVHTTLEIIAMARTLWIKPHTLKHSLVEHFKL